MAQSGQRGMGSSPWDSAMKATVNPPTGSSMSAMGCSETAPGSGINSSGAGDHLEGVHEFDNGVLGVPGVHGGSGMTPGHGTGVRNVGGQAGGMDSREMGASSRDAEPGRE